MLLWVVIAIARVKPKKGCLTGAIAGKKSAIPGKMGG
jgi:hypothetical protein